MGFHNEGKIAGSYIANQMWKKKCGDFIWYKIPI